MRFGVRDFRNRTRARTWRACEPAPNAAVHVCGQWPKNLVLERALWRATACSSHAPIPACRSTRAFRISFSISKAPGVTRRPIKMLTGGAHFNEIFLDNVRDPGGEPRGSGGSGLDGGPVDPGVGTRPDSARVRRADAKCLSPAAHGCTSACPVGRAAHRRRPDQAAAGRHPHAHRDAARVWSTTC